MIDKKILVLLSKKEVKQSIETSISALKKIYPEMTGIDYLAIAPSLRYRPNAVLILAFLKKDSYIISQTLRESIEYWTECEAQNKLFVLNSVDLEEELKDQTINKEEYERLKYSSIKYDDAFYAETPEELQEQFEKNYEKFLSSKLKEGNIIMKEKQPLKKEDLQVGEKLRLQLEKEIQKEEERKRSQNIRMLFKEGEFPEQRHLSNLRKSANKHYREVSKEDCKKMEDDLRLCYPGHVKADKNVLLHLVIQKHTKRKGYNAGDVMAMIKYLFGIDPMTKATEKVLKSFDPIVDNINLQDLDGKTALHKSATSACGIISWLLRLKADPFIQDCNGKTFLEYIPSNWKNVKNQLELYMRMKKIPKFNC